MAKLPKGVEPDPLAPKPKNRKKRKPGKKKTTKKKKTKASTTTQDTHTKTQSDGTGDPDANVPRDSSANGVDTQSAPHLQAGKVAPVDDGIIEIDADTEHTEL